MNDEQTDDSTANHSRLLLAGQAWRASQPLPPEPDLARMTGHRRGKVLVAAAVAGVLTVATGAVALLGHHPGPGGVTAGTSPPADELRTLDQVVVHNGETVRAVGTVIAKPGKPVILCALGSVLPAGYDSSDTSCMGLPVRLTGLDLSQLPDVHTFGGTRVAKVTLTGIYRSQTIAVASVSPAALRPSGYNIPPVQPPCPAPAGGWRSGPMADRTALQHYLDQHKTDFGGTEIGFPSGRPGGPTGANGYDNVAQVLIVEVVRGDLPTVQTTLASLYSGNLCLQRGTYTSADLDAAAVELHAAVWRPTTTYVVGLGEGPTRVYLSVPVVDDKLYPALAKIEDRHGAGILDPDVAIRPAD